MHTAISAGGCRDGSHDQQGTLSITDPLQQALFKVTATKFSGCPPVRRTSDPPHWPTGSCDRSPAHLVIMLHRVPPGFTCANFQQLRAMGVYSSDCLPGIYHLQLCPEPRPALSRWMLTPYTWAHTFVPIIHEDYLGQHCYYFPAGVFMPPKPATRCTLHTQLIWQHWSGTLHEAANSKHANM